MKSTFTFNISSLDVRLYLHIELISFVVGLSSAIKSPRLRDDLISIDLL